MDEDKFNEIVKIIADTRGEPPEEVRKRISENLLKLGEQINELCSLLAETLKIFVGD